MESISKNWLEELYDVAKAEPELPLLDMPDDQVEGVKESLTANGKAKFKRIDPSRWVYIGEVYTTSWGEKVRVIAFKRFEVSKRVDFSVLYPDKQNANKEFRKTFEVVMVEKVEE